LFYRSAIVVTVVSYQILLFLIYSCFFFVAVVVVVDAIAYDVMLYVYDNVDFN